MTSPQACPMCEALPARPFFTYRATKYDALFGGRGPMVQFVACATCGLVYQRPRLDDAALREIYESRLRPFMGAASPDAPYLAYARQVALADFAWLLEAWQMAHGMPFPSTGQAFEIGCATGQFLLRLRERGWNACGVEPELQYSDYGRREYALDICTGFFEDVNPPSVDLIACLHVLEHVPDPLAFLRRARAALPLGGHVYVVVPNLRQYDHARRHPELFALLHLFAFSRNSLQALLAAAGFTVLQADESGRHLAVLAAASDRIGASERADDPATLVSELRRYRTKAFLCGGWYTSGRQMLARLLGPAGVARLKALAGKALPKIAQ